MKNIALSIVFLACSCASVKKSSSRIESSNQHTDNSTVQKEQSKTTTVTETAGVPVSTRPDSAAVSGYMPADDTVGFSQTVTAGAITMKTMVTPRRVHGRTTGYDITSKATKAPEVITAPVSRQTTVVETGKEQEHKAVQDKTTVTATTTNKTAFRFNMAGAVAVIGSIAVVVFLYLIYKYFKKPKREELL
ncbi:hypothetical protein [Chitinophaga varians]|uniref:hypothetical protein n=1 Tax=Chitinophaga varians TaxID=2202339 RepID=UPI00165FF805|nr:hypothetical protein [Chitinophaga varians]MBC9913196.1 hypothetical protein [Chitinophaga varians]